MSLATKIAVMKTSLVPAVGIIFFLPHSECHQNTPVSSVHYNSKMCFGVEVNRMQKITLYLRGKKMQELSVLIESAVALEDFQQPHKVLPQPGEEARTAGTKKL